MRRAIDLNDTLRSVSGCARFATAYRGAPDDEDGSDKGSRFRAACPDEHTATALDVLNKLQRERRTFRGQRRIRPEAAATISKLGWRILSRCSSVTVPSVSQRERLLRAKRSNRTASDSRLVGASQSPCTAPPVAGRQLAQPSHESSSRAGEQTALHQGGTDVSSDVSRRRRFGMISGRAPTSRISCFARSEWHPGLEILAASRSRTRGAPSPAVARELKALVRVARYHEELAIRSLTAPRLARTDGATAHSLQEGLPLAKARLNHGTPMPRIAPRPGPRPVATRLHSGS